MGIWAPNLQLLLFRTISSREFARRVKNMAAKLPTPSEVVGVDDLAIFWRRHPNKVCDALRKLTAKPKHREWSVGIALAIFGVDFLFVALREQYPKQHFALVKEIADTAATFIEKHREKFVAYARKVAKMNVDPSECFLEAMVGFLRHLQELPREVLILARFGFVEQIKGAAKKGIALKSIEEAKQTIGSGKYVFGNFWPVAKLTLEVSVKTFGAYLGYVSRRLVNLEFAYDPAKLDQVATETEIDALGNDADASAAEPDKF